MKKSILLPMLLVCFGVASASAFEKQDVKNNDPTCEKSMRLVKKKIGKPDEIIQLVPGTVSIVFRKKGLHFTFEPQGNSCVVTSSDF